MPTSREDQIIEGILCLSLSRRWHPISYYFRLHAAKNTIRKYLKQLVASGFLTVLSVSAPEQYRPRQQFQITDEGCHEAI
jgi:predicted ArsR family transcriptional regulator